MEPPVASSLSEFLQPHADSIRGMQQLGELHWQRGWNRATSGSYSVVVRRDPTELVVTATRSAKGQMKATDLVLVDSSGTPVHQHQPQPSSKTQWHCAIANSSHSVGAIIHTHSVWSTVLTTPFAPLGGVLLEGFEMLKGLSNAKEPSQPEWLPILSESKGTLQLAAQVQSALNSEPPIHALIIHQQGLFTWGRTLEEASRNTEIFEFLCEVVVRQTQMS